ncbi:S8 family serine peptidase [Phormidesmis sp. 146-12]
MKRLLLGMLLAGSFWLTGDRLFPSPNNSASAQTEDLFYFYQGKRIPLSLRSDAIAVTFNTVRTRGDSRPAYLKLQDTLQKAGTRGGIAVQVMPLGETYAIVKLPTGFRGVNTITQEIQQQPYIQTTLPVLTRSDRQDTIVLPNQIIVSFQPGLSQQQQQKILSDRNLEIIRPLRFSQDRYLVKSRTTDGTSILTVSNQLSQTQGVRSATPNFVQSLPSLQQTKNLSDFESTPGFDRSPNSSRRPSSPFLASSLLGFQWHLNSLPLKQCLNDRKFEFPDLVDCLNKPMTTKKSAPPRSDLRVPEAWKKSKQGQGVVVAVIDSLIQWDHPDLAKSLYKVTATDKCPNEVYGWDFSSEVSPSNSSDPCKVGDSDTRADATEVASLHQKLADSFLLSDAELLKRYPNDAAEIRQNNSGATNQQIAQKLRNLIRGDQVGSEFHGTWVSGVIAAQPGNSQGAIGVAPKAKILPVRAMGLNNRFSSLAYIEALKYAAERGADVINISLGGQAPTDGEVETIAEIFEAHPHLVIVASAGNEDSDQPDFPAAVSGVISVAATNFGGNRAPYSNYGSTLTIAAPGGDLSSGWPGGILTTGGTWLPVLWRGIPDPTARWAPTFDRVGQYWWVQGTSFSAPAVSGVVALMKGEDSQRRLTRDQLTAILKSTASNDLLNVSTEDEKRYRSLKSNAIPMKKYFFGNGLVNAEAAVEGVQRSIK